MSKRLRLFLLLSMTGNLVAFGLLGSKWLQRYHRQEWQSVRHRALQSFRPHDVVFLGDSQLDGLARSGLLASDLNLSNLAAPGRLVSGVCEQLQGLAPASTPCIVVFQAGINDLRAGANEGEILRRYTELAPLIQSRFPASRVIVLGLYPIVEGLPINPNASNAEIRLVNRRIASWCDENDFLYLDTFGLLSDDGQLDLEFTADGLHLNLKGNQMIDSLLSGFVAAKP